MRNSFLVLASLCVSFSATAAIPPNESPIQLKLEVGINGQQVLKPTMIVRPGQPTTYGELIAGQEKYFVTIEANRSSDNKSITVKAQIGEFKNGKRVVLGAPQIIALEKEPAKIEVSDDKTQASLYSLSVVAKTAEAGDAVEVK